MNKPNRTRESIKEYSSRIGISMALVRKWMNEGKSYVDFEVQGKKIFVIPKDDEYDPTTGELRTFVQLPNLAKLIGMNYATLYNWVVDGKWNGATYRGNLIILPVNLDDLREIRYHKARYMNLRSWAKSRGISVKDARILADAGRLEGARNYGSEYLVLVKKRDIDTTDANPTKIIEVIEPKIRKDIVVSTQEKKPTRPITEIVPKRVESVKKTVAEPVDNGYQTIEGILVFDSKVDSIYEVGKLLDDPKWDKLEVTRDERGRLVFDYLKRK